MKYQTVEQLSALRLHAMKAEYLRQNELPATNDLSFDDRLSMLVTAQYDARNNARIARLIREADLREPGAQLADIDYDPVRRLNKAEIAQLSDCSWIINGQNLIITGKTGVGKTYLLSAFGRAACMKGMKVRAYRTTRMLTDLEIGRGDGSYNKLIQDLTKPDLLILDDFGIRQFGVDVSQDLLEVFEERYHTKKSVAISAQLPVKDWPEIFKDPTIADAVLDRVVRNSYRLYPKGPSRRPSVEHKAEDDSQTADENV